MFGTILAGALLMSGDPGSLPAYHPQPQEAPAAAAQTNGDPITLEGIDVVGRPLDELIRGFVNEVADPNRGRSLARWDAPVCVGVAFLQVETAQYIADRISTVAGDLGLDVGAPGCTPNILIIATPDGAEMARAFGDEHRRALLPGGSGMTQGRAAFAAFQTADRPVRWWQIVVPTNAQTGGRAVRIPGECSTPCYGAGSAASFAPKISTPASRLGTDVVENIIRTIVIVDIDDVAGLSALQLADYIAMVSLAQVDPDAEIGDYASILNVLDNPAAADSLTNWDQSYLQGLYEAERSSSNARANHAAVISAIGRARERLRAGDEDEDVTQD